ncbi:MAG: hypothetical protein P8J44_06855, partial [Gammaproteobacteria bacterium]|nr:hypothetical protein [Gammaproteobacteria bacterium]
RVWQNRMPIVGHALRSHSISSLENMLIKARNVDQSVKGLMNLKPWDELTSMILDLTGTHTAIEAVTN